MNNITSLNKKEMTSIAGGNYLETAREYTVDPLINGATWLAQDVDWKTVLVGGASLFATYKLTPKAYNAIVQGAGYLGGGVMTGLRALHRATATAKPKKT